MTRPRRAHTCGQPLGQLDRSRWTTRVIHRTTRCHPRAVDDGGQHRAAGRTLYAGGMRVVPNPQHLLLLLIRYITHWGEGRHCEVPLRTRNPGRCTGHRWTSGDEPHGHVAGAVRCPSRRQDGELTVTGTDLELTIRLSVPVHSDRDGSAVVPARLVADIVKALPAGAVEVSVADDEMSISAGRSQFSVRPLSLERLSGPGRARRRAGHVDQRSGRRRTASGRAGRVDRRRPGGA